MESFFAKALNGDDLSSVGLNGENKTAVHRKVVHENGAHPAISFTTSLLRSCQAQAVP
jgi:hypothetical protein